RHALHQAGAQRPDGGRRGQGGPEGARQRGRPDLRQGADQGVGGADPDPRRGPAYRGPDEGADQGAGAPDGMSHRAAQHRAQDRTALALVVIVGFFVVASMLVVVIFAFSGVPSGENIWAGLFSIITAILG